MVNEKITTNIDKVYPDSSFPNSRKKKMSNGNSNGSAAITAAASTSSTSGGGVMMIGSRPSLIVVNKMKFLIMDAPRQSNLHLYIKELRKHSVKDVVRVCEPTYLAGELSQAGIALHEMEYQDGTSPSNDLINQWLTLVFNTFYNKNTPSSSSATSADGGGCIAVHCIAGLGRAPVMVAIALIEFEKYDPVDAVTLIRRHRRGAINEKQLLYLSSYKKQWRNNRSISGSGSSSKKGSSNETSTSSCCVIS